MTQFNAQLHEFTEGMKDLLCFPEMRRYLFAINEVHKYAYWWLEKMGRLNRAVTTEAEGRALCQTYMQLVKELEHNEDFSSARLLILRGAPVIDRYGDKPAQDEVEIVTFDEIVRDKLRQPVNDAYQELCIAFTRYENTVREGIGFWLDRNGTSQLRQQNYPALDAEVESEMDFIHTVPLVAPLVHWDADYFILQGKDRVSCIEACVDLHYMAAQAYDLSGHPDKAVAALEKANSYYKELLAEVKLAKKQMIDSWQRKRNGAEGSKQGYIVPIDAGADLQVAAELECERWLGTTEVMLNESTAGLEKKLNAVHRQKKPLQHTPKNKKGEDLS